MKEMRPSLQDLECLSALLELRSAKRTADQLGMSQPAVSHALRRLREFFSDSLFVREGSGLRPTRSRAHLTSTAAGSATAFRPVAECFRALGLNCGRSSRHRSTRSEKVGSGKLRC